MCNFDNAWKKLLLFSISGHTLSEIFVLREGKFRRMPDLVIWPGINLDFTHSGDISHTYGPLCAQTCLLGFGQSETQTSLLGYIDKLEI